MRLPGAELTAAHAQAKEDLLRLVQRHTGRSLREGVLTLGFARRSTGYKRGGLLLSDLERLRALGRGRLQLVFAGKAHPHDAEGKALIQRIVACGRALGEDVPLVYLPDYDMAQARVLVAGVDVWLNTPLRPLEASGTSGMKAAHNGVPSLSVLDGWWLEGCIEGLTGWAVGQAQAPAEADAGRAQVDAEDAEALYRKLAERVLPAFAAGGEAWHTLMRHAIALNASFFNSHRMVQQYSTHAYLSAA